jgi:hypothetical protein
VSSFVVVRQPDGSDVSVIVHSSRFYQDASHVQSAQCYVSKCTRERSLDGIDALIALGVEARVRGGR